MITYNSTYVKKLSKDVSEVEKVFYEIPAAFTKDGKLYMHNNESSSYYTDGLNQPYTAKEFIRIQFLKTTELLPQSKHQILICKKEPTIIWWVLFYHFLKVACVKTSSSHMHIFDDNNMMCFLLGFFQQHC